ARRYRPSGHRTAEKCDELAALHRVEIRSPVASQPGRCWIRAHRQARTRFEILANEVIDRLRLNLKRTQWTERKAHKMIPQLQPRAVRLLRERLHGRLISPGDADYNTARKVWNGRIDRRPALVAFCANQADVVTAVEFARENAVLLAVRGGGHSCAGTAVFDDALVI